MKPPTHVELRLLEQRIAELEAENAYLSHAAQLFGEIAERLNQQLSAERRRGTDTHLRDRGSEDTSAIARKLR